MPDTDLSAHLPMSVFFGRLTKHLERLARAAQVLDDASADDPLRTPSDKSITALQNTDYLRQALNDLVAVSAQLSQAETLGTLSAPQSAQIAAGLSLDEIRRLLAPEEATALPDDVDVAPGEMQFF